MDKESIELLSAWLVPIIGIVTIITAFLQIYYTAKKRKDDLFDKRFDFYKRLERYWLSTNSNGPPDITDLFPIASEARFLFGKDIERHILSLAGKGSSNSMFAEDDFTKPFHKYLTL